MSTKIKIGLCGAVIALALSFFCYTLGYDKAQAEGESALEQLKLAQAQAVIDAQNKVKLEYEIQIQNEEWAIQKKYPWRARKLDSASDLQMCKTLIYNSDLTDEEKKQEEAELIRKYQSQQNN